MATISIEDVLNGTYTTKKRNKVKSMQNIENALTLWCEQVVMQQFKWNNLPEEIPFDAIETGLFYYGAVVFFKVADNLFCLPCTQADAPNLYQKPLEVYAIGYNGVQYAKPLRVSAKVSADFTRVDEPEAVLIQNNRQMISTYSLIKPMINRLIYIWQSIGIQECLCRSKAVIHANKDLSEAMKRQFDNIFNNAQPFIIVNDKQYTGDKMDVMQYDSSFDVTNYWDDFDNTLSLLLTLIGVKNLNQKDKKERLTSNEVENNDELIGIAKDTRLDYREDACKKIKTLFNIDITCESNVVKKDVTKDKTKDNKDTEL